MAEEAVRQRLGRGLAALIGDVGEETAAVDRLRATRKVPIEFVRANPRNPRRTFREEDLQELADSVRERGIIQPIVVRTVAGAVDAYEIVAGERRWRAAQLAGLHEIPVHLVEVGDREALELAIIENVQRADLNALEEAQGYNELIEQFGYSQTDLAKVIGKSRSHVANTLRLLKLSDKVQTYLRDGQLTAGHARAAAVTRQSRSSRCRNRRAGPECPPGRSACAGSGRAGGVVRPGSASASRRTLIPAPSRSHCRTGLAWW